MQRDMFRKLFCVCVAMIGFIFVMSNNKMVYANTWLSINGEWYYVDEHGEAYANSIVDRDGKKYFVGDEGKIVRNSFFEYGDKYYFAGADGALARNEFKYIEYDIAARADLAPGRYYFGDKCQCYRKVGSNFKKTIDGRIFAFDENGLVLTGWLDVDGSMIEDKASSLTDGVYYADESGALYFNRWFDFNNDEGTYYISGEETLLGNTEYDYLDHMWMYFDDNGKKIKSDNTADEKVRKINGQEYAFDENGVMITYLTKTGGLNLSQKSNPTSLTSAKVYDGEEGYLVKDTWQWMYPSKELDETEYKDQEMHWWYVDKQGMVTRNKIKEVDGKKYVFDGIGRLKAGFVLFDGGRHYVANYLPEDLESDDFIYTVLEGSKLHGQELSDIRYFGDDDKLDGTMKTGEVQIELADGVFTFAFADGGIAYGNRHHLRKKGNVYYINGLKLTAKEDMSIGIIKTDSDEYKLIDKKGKIKRGSRKIVKDDEGNYILMMGNEIVGYKRANSLPHGDVDIKWRNGRNGEPAGFYYYHKDAEKGVDKYHYGMCLDPSIVTTLSADDADDIPDELRVNFR